MVFKQGGACFRVVFKQGGACFRVVFKQGGACFRVVFKQGGACFRVVFWTDSGASPRIERVDYDGNGRKAIVTTNIASAFGLAVDLHSQCCLGTACFSRQWGGACHANGLGGGGGCHRNGGVVTGMGGGCHRNGGGGQNLSHE